VSTGSRPEAPIKIRALVSGERKLRGFGEKEIPFEIIRLKT
jgi:hypothetical protein